VQNTPQGGLKGCQSVHSEPELSITSSWMAVYVARSVTRSAMWARVRGGTGPLRQGELLGVGVVCLRALYRPQTLFSSAQVCSRFCMGLHAVVVLAGGGAILLWTPLWCLRPAGAKTSVRAR
jgi:hypothetical protein